jgi:hypothetical protein
MPDPFCQASPAVVNHLLLSGGGLDMSGWLLLLDLDLLDNIGGKSWGIVNKQTTELGLKSGLQECSEGIRVQVHVSWEIRVGGDGLQGPLMECSASLGGGIDGVAKALCPVCGEEEESDLIHEL